jgi:DNA-binding NtrC family response regulator
MTTKVALIVDDVQDLLEVVAEAVALALPDHVVHTAESAQAAEALLADLERRGEILDLLIADQSLGGRTGLDLMAQVQVNHDPALLLITGRATSNVADQAAALGARILWKPFRLQALVETIHEVVARGPV